MIKTLLKQIILEKCIDTLFSSIRKNLIQYKDINYIITTVEDKNCIVSDIKYIYNNKEYKCRHVYSKNFAGFTKYKNITLHEERLIDHMHTYIKFQ